MAERPVFIPSKQSGRLVDERLFSFEWSPGLALGQKKKNVAALHGSAAKAGYAPLLEVSTKSDELLGQRLSAFNLQVDLREGFSVPLECAFQGSKVFENGGPFNDLFFVDARQAKRDSRLSESGKLKGFLFEGQWFPLVPKTAFYDWIYLRSLYPHREYLKRLGRYRGFTDIEFNPLKSINCQARSCATLVALEERGKLDECMDSPESFIRVLLPDSLLQPHSDNLRQSPLL
jgi:hypothetical protein